MVLKKNLRFKIGDWIVHHFHGVGKVNDIEEKGLDGDKNTFYKVSTKEIDYWIPIEKDDKDHLEPLRTKEDFHYALEILAQPPVPISDHHQARKKQIHEKWLEGNLNSRAELMRDLNGRMKRDHLNFNEKEMLEKVISDFINEWIIADKSLTPTEANNLINKSLQEGIKKAQKEKTSDPLEEE